MHPLAAVLTTQPSPPQVTFLPQDSSLLNNTFILTARLPQSFQEFHSTTYDVVCKVRLPSILVWHDCSPTCSNLPNAPQLTRLQDYHSTACALLPVQFVGRNTAPVTVAAQSALEVAVSSVPGWNYGQMTQVGAGRPVQTRCGAYRIECKVAYAGWLQAILAGSTCCWSETPL